MRTLVYNALKNSSGIQSLVGTHNGFPNIHQASSLDFVPPRPFLTYRMHTGFNYQRLSDREYCQVWAHDNPGDYLVIDQLLKYARVAIESIASQGNFIQADWIETGVDLRDDAMNTITRYARFQLTNSLRRD